MDSILFPLADYWWIYASFLGFVALLLALDLGVFHKKAHAISFKEASLWSIFWVSLSLACNWAFYQFALHKLSVDPTYAAIPGFDAEVEASRVGLEFLTGFLIEKALAIDNIFVFVMIFGALRTPAIYQHRILFLGIIGAIFFRGIFIALSSQLMAYHWVVLVFGAFLVLTGVKMFFSAHQPEKDLTNSWQMRALKRLLPVTPEIHGQKFIVKKNGTRYVTPLLIALVLIELIDVVFAMDSVPAIFAVTREPLIVFISNILAIMGLRSLYFMLAGIVDRFVYLKYGLALVLIFVGLKMVWLNEAMGGKFPISWSLGIIATLILGSIGISLIATSNRKKSKQSKQGAAA
jgi:tellurite resistance protein TerC